MQFEDMYLCVPVRYIYIYIYMSLQAKKYARRSLEKYSFMRGVGVRTALYSICHKGVLDRVPHNHHYHALPNYTLRCYHNSPFRLPSTSTMHVPQHLINRRKQNICAKPMNAVICMSLPIMQRKTKYAVPFPFPPYQL